MRRKQMRHAVRTAHTTPCAAEAASKKQAPQAVGKADTQTGLPEFSGAFAGHISGGAGYAGARVFVPIYNSNGKTPKGAAAAGAVDFLYFGRIDAAGGGIGYRLGRTEGFADILERFSTDRDAVADAIEGTEE